MHKTGGVPYNIPSSKQWCAEPTSEASQPETDRSATTAKCRRVLQSVKKDPASIRNVRPDRPWARAVLRGIAVSPGVVVRKAYFIHETTIALETVALVDDNVASELARFNEAREKTLSDLRAVHEKLAAQVGHHEATIFGSHAAILGDENFSNQVCRYIMEKHQSAEVALQSVLNDYGTTQFQYESGVYSDN